MGDNRIKAYRCQPKRHCVASIGVIKPIKVERRQPLGKKIRVGALISGGGTNLQAIIDASRRGAIDAELVFVGSDNPGAYGLERATTSMAYRLLGWITRRSCGPSGKALKRRRLPEDFRLDDLRRQSRRFSPPPPIPTSGRLSHHPTAAEAVLLKAMQPFPF